MTRARARNQEVGQNRRSVTRYRPARVAVQWGAAYVPARDVIASVVDGEAVLQDREHGREYTLNPVGTVIWELLDGRRPLAAVLTALTERFEVPRRQLERDLAGFVAELRTAGLIEERR